MKTRLSFLALALIFSVAISGCKRKTTPEPTPEEKQLDKLAKTWVIATGANAVTINTVDVSSDWTNFELTFTDGGYTTLNTFSADVWPNSGTWEFAVDDVNTLIRDGGLNISINVTDNALLMQFNYALPGGRIEGVEGDWIFNMVPK